MQNMELEATSSPPKRSRCAKLMFLTLFVGGAVAAAFVVMGGSTEPGGASDATIVTPSPSPTSSPTSSPTPAPPPTPTTPTTPAPTIPTTPPPTPSAPLSTPLGTSAFLPAAPSHRLLSTSSLGELFTLSCSLPGEPPRPAGRSYDGHAWESVHPLLLPFECSSSFCDATLPSASYSCTLTASAPPAPSSAGAASRFLQSASFGPTATSIASFSSPAEYVADQLSLPPTYHRPRYRERTNAEVYGPSESGSLSSPCVAGARFHSGIFNEVDHDLASTFTVESGVDALVLTVTSAAGVKATEITDFVDCATSGPQPYQVCQIITTGSDANGAVRYGENCDCYKVNFPLTFTSTSPPEGLVLFEDADLAPLSPAVAGVSILASAPAGDCVAPSPDTPVYVRSTDGSYHLFSPRLVLDANPASSPPTSAPSPNRACQSAPKTFLNADTCVLAPDCSPAAYSDATFVLTEEMILKWETLSGIPMRFIDGLTNTGDENTMAYSTAAVCESKHSTRWLISDGACPSPTSIDASTQGLLDELFASSLTNPSDLVVDVPIQNSEDRCAAAGLDGAAVTSGGRCYTHVHHDLYDVYDFSTWGAAHPGNVDARAAAPPRSNPIKAQLLSTFAGGGVDAAFHYPGWHIMNNWKTTRLQDFMHHRIGRLGDTLNFADLPRFAQTPEMAEEVGASLTGGRVEELFENCGSPGEVASDPYLGNRYTINAANKDDARDQQTDQFTSQQMNNKKSTWATIAFGAEDQLRHRVAWALAQIEVITEKQVNFLRDTEIYGVYYDIFVRNAFGNYRDVLKEVSYSPMMAIMLTYMNSKSLAFQLSEGSELFPDENYAREIMQLFTIGLFKLNLDGTHKKDVDGNSLPTYTNDDIMNFARLWTGFTYNSIRGGTEAFSGDNSNNLIDPLAINHFWRDRFPKSGLTSTYIGDGYPLCADLPERAWLRSGTTWRYMGSSVIPDLSYLGVQDTDADDVYAFQLPSTSNLRGVLEAAKAAGKGDVTLDANLECVGAECGIDTLKVINLDGAYYEYVRVPCVEQAFFADGHPVTNEWLTHGYCASGSLPLATAGCCSTNGLRSEINCDEFSFIGEKTTWATVEARCEAAGSAVCAVGPRSHNLEACWSRDKGWVKEANKFWMTEPCAVQAQVHTDSGYISIVHELPEYHDGKPSSGKRDEVKVDSLQKFKVDWADTSAVTDLASDPAASCESLGGSKLLCDVTITDSQAFLEVPSKNEMAATLKIGAAQPSMFDSGAYSRSTALSTDEVGVYVDSSNGLSIATIFEVELYAGYTQFFMNKKSVVEIGGASFSNPPSFMSLVEPTRRDAEYETEAVLDEYMRNPNTPPFVADFFIKRFTTSNPSPRYVEAVATAFVTGSYEGLGSNKYGDLEATIAAVLLDREATSSALEADTAHGKMREPLLKFMHVLRALEYSPKDGNEVELDSNSLDTNVGMSYLRAASVFNFYQSEYSGGAAALVGLVAPESQVLSTPTIIGWLNGMLSLVTFGLSSCDSGFGMNGKIPTTCWKIREEKAGFENEEEFAAGMLEWSPTDSASDESIVDELNLLLTGDRLSESHKQLIAEHMLERRNAEGGGEEEALKAAILLIASAPEFQVERNLGEEAEEERVINDGGEEEEEEEEFDDDDYKAMVLIFLDGAADSFNVLIPHSDCSNNDLQAQYQTLRTDVALSKNSLLTITAPAEAGQPCDTFGINPALPLMQELYEDGDAAFIANVGVLVEPMTLDEWHAESKQRPPNLFAHNSQQVATQTVHAQETTAPGVLGKIKDALVTQGLSTQSYSINGNQRILVGQAGVTTGPAILNKNNGVTPLDPYDSVEWLKEPVLKLAGEKMNKGVMQEIWADAMAQGIVTSDILIEKLESDGSLEQEFAATTGSDVSALALQLEQAASVIAARSVIKHKRDVFALNLGGFDTHSDATATLATLMGQLNDGLESFSEEMKLQGVWDKVVIGVVSEFGRTLVSNGAGTDHAWGGHAMLLGGGLNGGTVFGNYPETLEPGVDGLDVGNGRFIPTTPWEGMWKPIAEWLGVEEGMMDTVLPNLGNFQEEHFIDNMFG